MRRLIVSNVMSLDGFFEGPNKNIDWFMVDDEFFDYAKEMLRAADTLLFGRATYEHMAAYWPPAPPDEIANSKLIKGNVADEIAELKRMPGKDVVLLGSSILASSLLQEGLIDEYRVILVPLLLGCGSPLFKDIAKKIEFKLEKTRLLKSGVVVLYYHTT